MLEDLNKDKVEQHIEDFKSGVENFICGVKLHKLIPNSKIVEITDDKSKTEYHVDYFYVIASWKRLMTERNYDLALSKLTSGNLLVVNYENGKIYLKEEKIKTDKILEDLDYVTKFGIEGL